MMEKISKSVAASNPVNVSEVMMSLTSTIICRIGFGKRYDEDKATSGRSRFHTLLNETLNVFVAGADTSAATVVWAMTYLMKNPRAMKKVQLEIRSLIGGNKGFVNEDDVQELHYLKAVVKETMRLQPTVPLLIPRETIQKCVIDGYAIPAKTRVFVNAWAIGRDPEAWENPEEFYPERFIDSCIDFKGQHFELIPFGAGRRICPGLNMGIATVDLALANLLYKFDWEMPLGIKSHDLDFDVLLGIAMHKKNALSLLPKLSIMMSR
ncbi:cytochrome P450 83B1 [Citrus sinensis]|nr:cytochrome P450 83B1 [Citrus sinensis]